MKGREVDSDKAKSRGRETLTSIYRIRTRTHHFIHVSQTFVLLRTCRVIIDKLLFTIILFVHQSISTSPFIVHPIPAFRTAGYRLKFCTAVRKIIASLAHNTLDHHPSFVLKYALFCVICLFLIILLCLQVEYGPPLTAGPRLARMLFYK